MKKQSNYRDMQMSVKRNGFTLLEMLVVIAIIGLLLGILLPILGKVKEQSKRTKARHVVAQLTVAWQAYYRNYRMFPSNPELNPDPANPERITQMDKKAMLVLAGSNYCGRGGVEYMEFTTNDWVKVYPDGSVGGLRDPWDVMYQVTLDTGKAGGNDDATAAYDGKVKVPQSTTPILKDVAVWSRGPDKADDSGSKGDDVKSWE